MAERRMFSKTIIDSDAFLDMPLTAQALYFHLSMRADDDGFVNNPKKVQRMTGCSDDDVKILLAKSFVIPFESGICVIRHWKIHNYIQKDRYRETVYQSEMQALKVGQDNAYSLMDTECIQDVSKMDTQVRLGKVRLELGKDSASRVREANDISDKGDQSTGESLTVQTARGADKQSVDHSMTRFDEFWKVYPRKSGKGDAQKAWDKLRPDKSLFDKIIAALSLAVKCDQWQRDNGQYIPNPATWIRQRRWEDEYSSALPTRPDYSEGWGDYA